MKTTPSQTVDAKKKKKNMLESKIRMNQHKIRVLGPQQAPYYVNKTNVEREGVETK